MTDSTNNRPSAKLAPISAIIITKNEAHNIKACLESVEFAAERVVIDSGSTDDTVKIAKSLGATVIETDWPGFGPQFQRGITYSTQPWLLYVDADERITPELAQEIMQTVDSPNPAPGYEMPRLSSYCGQFMKHSGWWPDRVIRLFQRGLGQHCDNVVHPNVIIQGKIARLQNHIVHYSFLTMDDVLKKMNSYSSLGAQSVLAKGKKPTLFTALYKGFWAFFRTYIIRAGFLDGQKGLMLAISNAEGTYYKYIKAMLMRTDKK